MNSRERVKKAINHQETDRIPLDLGSTLVTGIQASTYAKLRQSLGLKDKLVKIADPFQILAEVDMEVIKKLGIDTVGLWLPTNFFGFKNERWKPWKLFDGTKVLVPEKFTTKQDDEGNIFLYPQDLIVKELKFNCFRLKPLNLLKYFMKIETYYSFYLSFLSSRIEYLYKIEM